MSPAHFCVDTLGSVILFPSQQIPCMSVAAHISRPASTQAGLECGDSVHSTCGFLLPADVLISCIADRVEYCCGTWRHFNSKTTPRVLVPTYDECGAFMMLLKCFDWSNSTREFSSWRGRQLQNAEIGIAFHGRSDADHHQ
eukprot:TsM_000409700 transcript=TsM_000409700 gene=TsM_000409700